MSKDLFIEIRFMNVLILMMFSTKIGQGYAQICSLLGCFVLFFFSNGGAAGAHDQKTGPRADKYCLG